jgi:glycosyltransferase involved in cell wall biosynthesis
MGEKMRVLFPIIRGCSGGDVYFERLKEVMEKLGVDSSIKYYPSYFEIYPPLVKPFYNRKDNYDVIHSASDWGFIFKAYSKPLVIITHHLVFEIQYQKYKSVPQKVYHKLLFSYTKKSFETADKIIAMSNHTKEKIEEIFGISDSDVIYNGIDTDLFRPTDIKDDPYPDKIKLFFVGNLTKRKGAHLLPQIMGKLDDRFVLFYTSGLRSKEASPNKNMISLGRLSVEKLLKMYNLCDILLVPSVVEGGFSYAAAEAMACEKPVVASVSSGLYEMIENRGGFLCNTVEEFVEKIDILAEDETLRKEMGKYNRNKVLKKFNLLDTGKQYKRVYEKLIEEGTKNG